MIQGSTKSNIKAYIQTKDNRINNSTSIGTLKHLWKLTNDMSGEVHYAYPTETIYDRYIVASFIYNATPNMYSGQVNLELAGFWKYQVFEVTWIGGGEMYSGNMPPTEEFLFDPAGDNLGVVQGEVTKGKMYLEPKRGTEEVTYTQNAKSVQTLTLVNGGSGYTTAPTITINTGTISQATATCTLLGSSVTSVTLTNGGSGYTENPTVHVSGGGTPSIEAVITADINETNYIYTS